MKNIKKALLISICLIFTLTLLTGCGSEAQKEMKDSVKVANELLDKNEVAFDVTTKDTL